MFQLIIKQNEEIKKQNTKFFNKTNESIVKIRDEMIEKIENISSDTD
jgi:hypothetical protein